MAFQGFAREEQFSNHQINIDIGSVIDNDLAEAKRQSKFMAKNVAMQEKWSNMYLDAMRNKHAVEKKNREDNFKFFMENRKKINDQIKYNNEVKYKDAGKDRHVPTLAHILGPALLGLAVNVGGAAIKKFAADGAKADAAKTSDAEGQVTALYSQIQTPEQRKELVRVLDLVEKGLQEEVNAVLSDKSNPLYGLNFVTAESLAHANGLNKLQKEKLEYSPANVVRYGLEYGRKFKATISGTEFTLATIMQSSVNAATRDEFFKQLSNGFINERIPSNINGYSRGVISEQWQKLTADWKHKSYNTEVIGAKKAQNERFVGKAQEVFDRRGLKGVVAFFTNPGPQEGSEYPGSPVYPFGRARGHEMLREFAMNGGMHREAVTELMATPGLIGTDPRSLNEQLTKDPTPSKAALEWKKVQDHLINKDAQDLQREDIENRINAEELIKSAVGMPQETARSIFYSLQNGKAKAGLNRLPLEVQKRVLKTFSDAAGITEPPVTTSFKVAGKSVPKTVRDSLVEASFVDVEGKEVNIKGYKDLKHYGKLMATADNAFVQWVGGLIDKYGWDPEVVNIQGLVLDKFQNEEDPEHKGDIQALKRALKVQTINPETGKQLPDGPRLVNFDMQSQLSDGVSAYKDLIYENPGRKLALDEINLLSLKTWASSVNIALGDDRISQQNTLSRTNPLVSEILKRNDDASVGQIYNAFVKQAKEQGMDHYQPLPESQFLTQQEIRQLNQKHGSWFTRASQPVKELVAGGGQGINAATASYLRREGTLQPGDHFEHGTQGIKNAQGVFANQEVADSAAMVAEAYPNMTWTSTQRTKAYQEDMKRRGYSPSDTSNHLKGISFDAAGHDAQRLKQDIDSGKVKGLDYYIGPGYTHVHFDIIGPVSIAGQQPQQQPSQTEDVTTATSMQPLFKTKGGHNIFVGNDGKYYVKKPGEVLRTEISEQMMKAYEEDAKAGTVRAVLGGSN